MRRITALALAVIMCLSVLIASGCAPTPIVITLDYQNQADPIVVEMFAGDKLDPSYTPALSDATFKGWFTNPECTGEKIDIKNATFEESVTLYAKRNFNANVVSQFHFNYEGAPDSVLVDPDYRGTVPDFPELPQREAWVFLGWSLIPQGGSLWGENDLISANHDSPLNFYAYWELEEGHVHEYEYTSTKQPSCLTEGYDINTCVCGATERDNYVDALGHEFHFPQDEDDYFTMVMCSRQGCVKTARRDSLRTYDDVFVFTFDADTEDGITTENSIEYISGLFDQIKEHLESLRDYDPELDQYVKNSDMWQANKNFEQTLFDVFDDKLTYITEQYQYAYVFYCVKASEWEDAFETISNFRTECFSNYYSIYGLIYDTCYREYFFDKVEGGWTDEDIAYALSLAGSYGNEEYQRLNEIITEIELWAENPSGNKTFAEQYQRYVETQNAIAALSGYENYLEYAYENVYGREYTPAEVATMRTFVKTYIAPLFSGVYTQYSSTANRTFATGSANEKWDVALSQNSILDSIDATNIVAEYFKLHTLESAEDEFAKNINFFKEASDLMKNGNYFTGSYEGAFSYWIRNALNPDGTRGQTILYFGPGSYSGAFTFIHEFGHYYDNVYNPNSSVSMDLSETQSQGNEMLFLAWLRGKLAEEGASGAYGKVRDDQLLNALFIVLIATCVDEFEQGVYTGSYTNFYAEGDFQGYWDGLLSSYGLGTLASNYASYYQRVCISSACYYISYAMSMLPCLQIYAIASSSEEGMGFETAQEMYLKLFSYSYDETVEPIYTEVLTNAGLSTPFKKDLYEIIESVILEQYPNA